MRSQRLHMSERTLLQVGQVGVLEAGPIPGLAAAVFLVHAVAIAYLAAYLRLTTGSIWPAIVLHGAWVAVMQGAFELFTPSKTVWVGDSGILVACCSVVLTALIVRGRWAARRAPGEPPFTELRASHV